jgi:hypothetical protein
MQDLGLRVLYVVGILERHVEEIGEIANAMERPTLRLERAADNPDERAGTMSGQLRPPVCL